MKSHVKYDSETGLVEYFEHLCDDEYMNEKGKVLGEFYGAFAKEWGLDATEISLGDPRFRLFAACDTAALSGNPALKRARVSEVKAEEFTFSPPKSVSLIAAIDQRAKAAILAAVKESGANSLMQNVRRPRWLRLLKSRTPSPIS
jgi:hypothetical protein